MRDIFLVRDLDEGHFSWRTNEGHLSEGLVRDIIVRDILTINVKILNCGLYFMWIDIV